MGPRSQHHLVGVGTTMGWTWKNDSQSPLRRFSALVVQMDIENRSRDVRSWSVAGDEQRSSPKAWLARIPFEIEEDTEAILKSGL